MLLSKFNLFLIFAIIFNNTNAFTGSECLSKNFEVSISHQGKPFGLSKVNLEVLKSGCTIIVKHERFKYLKKSWSIDVCREPIHIKKNGGSDVLKKETECTKKSKSEFCESMKNLLTVIQDDALIFAEGEKEKIDSHHGKSYCAYLLLKEYLDHSRVFNRGQDYSKLFRNGYSTNNQSSIKMKKVEAPIPRPVVEGVETDDTSVEASKVSRPEVEDEKKPVGVGTY